MKNGTAQIESGIAYVAGRVEAQTEAFEANIQSQIKAFAVGLGISEAELASGVDHLLRRTPNGTLLGTTHHLPNLRYETATRHPSVESLAVAGGTHFSKAPKVVTGKNKSGDMRGMNQTNRRHKAAVPIKKDRASGVIAYWAKMTPEERTAENIRRRKVAMQNKRAKDKAALTA